MPSYFDAADVAAKLPAAITARADFDDLAAECEYDVVRHYTRSTSRGALSRGARRGASARSRTRVRGFGAFAFAGLAGQTGRPYVSPDGRRTVLLEYYEKDPEDLDLTDADVLDFLDAFGFELARLVRHRAGERDADGNQKGHVTRERRGQRETEYADAPQLATRDTSLPPGFGSYLRPFDLRVRAYV